MRIYKGIYVCCLAWIFAGFFWVSIGFERYIYIFCRDFGIVFYGIRDFGTVTVLIFQVL